MLAATAIASDNTNNAIISGSFGVAWLDSDGIVRLHDGTNVAEPVPGTKVYAILAADLLEEGSDQLVYLDDARKALYIYSFKTQKTMGPFGHNVRTMAVGRCSAEESYPSLFACTFGGDSYRWTKEVMDGGWIHVPGDFVQASRGRFDQRGDLDDFAVVNGEGNVYIYSTKWQTYSKVVEGKRIAAVLAGNFTTAQGDEIAMLDKEGNVFLYQNRTVEDLGIKATCLAVWRNKEGLDTLYALANLLGVAQYDRETKTWTWTVPTAGALSTSLLVNDRGVLFFTGSIGGQGKFFHKIEGGVHTNLFTAPLSSFVLGKYNTPLARYRFGNVPFKPYIDELRTPSGKNILRDAPWDHLHHHALMYAIRVNGCNFWEESNDSFGKQSLFRMSPVINENGDVRKIKEGLNWNTPEGKTLLSEDRHITVDQHANATLLDWQGTLTAEVDATLGGPEAGHYYGLGMRFLEEMDKDGRFFNDTGNNEREVVRGDESLTLCKWMAYTAKLEGQPVTVAMFDHPSNPVPMTVFTMGDASDAFAYMSATMNMHRKAIELKAGESFAFKYRVAVWDGEVSPETVGKAYAEYVR